MSDRLSVGSTARAEARRRYVLPLGPTPDAGDAYVAGAEEAAFRAGAAWASRLPRLTTAEDVAAQPEGTVIRDGWGVMSERWTDGRWRRSPAARGWRLAGVRGIPSRLIARPAVVLWVPGEEAR